MKFIIPPNIFVAVTFSHVRVDTVIAQSETHEAYSAIYFSDNRFFIDYTIQRLSRIALLHRQSKLSPCKPMHS